MNKRIVSLFAFGIFCFKISLFSATVSTSGSSIEEKIVQIKSGTDIEALFNSANTSDERITVLEQLSGAVTRLNVDPSTSTPIWLRNVLTQALSSTNVNEKLSAIRQIGNLKVSLLADNLITLYGQTNDVNIRVKCIRSLGDMQSVKALPLLRTIINAQGISQETDEAIISARKLCAVELISDISVYAKYLEAIKPDTVAVKDVKKMVSSGPLPEVSLMIAKGTLQALGNGKCGQ